MGERPSRAAPIAGSSASPTRALLAWSDPMSRRTVSRALFAVALSVSLAACGDSKDGSAASASSSSSQPSAQACEPVPPTAAPAEGLSTDLTQKPQPQATDAAPPCGLVVSDIVVG